MPKSKSVQRREAIQKEVTYRLHLTDSNNHAVFIDVDVSKLEDSKECYPEVSMLLDKYKYMLSEHEQTQKQSIENDAVVAERVEKNKNKLDVNEQAKETSEGDSEDQA